MLESKNKFEDMDQYIQSFPKDVQEILQKIRKIIKDIIPDSEEVISYQIPTFNLNGKYFIYFAGYKNHVSLYPIHSEGTPFEKELNQYISGQGTAKFPLSEPIPYDLIKKIVEFKLNRK